MEQKCYQYRWTCILPPPTLRIYVEWKYKHLCMSKKLNTNCDSSYIKNNFAQTVCQVQLLF